MTEFEDKVVLVTGAAGGIGRATAELLAERGASLGLVDIDARRLDVTAQACESLGAKTRAIAVDQRRSEPVNSAVASIHSQFGRIDALANIVGIYPYSLLESTDDETWDDVLRVNLTGIFYFCRAVVPLMRAAGAGSIVSIASGAAIYGAEGQAHYAASKAGLIAMTKSLAREVAPTIRANVVAPGPTATGIKPPGDPELLARLHAKAAGQYPILLERPGQPREIAEVIAFLCSDRSSFVTAQTFHANGGRFVV